MVIFSKMPGQLTISELKRWVAAYPGCPHRTVKLEGRLLIGTGFHNKWYRSQKEHMLGWLEFQQRKVLLARLDPKDLPARAMWNRLKCSPLMFWLAECAEVESERLMLAEHQAINATRANPRDGEPYGRMMKVALPWQVVEAAIFEGQSPISPQRASLMGEAAFRKLCEKQAKYRKHLAARIS